jgi:adenylate kinase family enzyme
MKTLYLLRGVSGAGKTTLAKTLAYDESCMISADDYFYDEEGNYNFNHNLLNEAHRYCLRYTIQSMVLELPNIVVHNTFTTEKELEPYILAAEENNYKVVSLIVENRHGNNSVHDVPEETLLKQEARLKQNIKLR